MKVLFLYTELAGYVHACMKAAAHAGVEVHVVRWPVKSEAPFRFDEEAGVRLYDRNDFDREGLIRLVEELQPRALLCSGWVDKDYVAVCRHFRGKISTSLGFDNPWEGTLKQRLAALYGSRFLRSAFDWAWVPGQWQKTFAMKLGFRKDEIRSGAYCADLPLFAGLWEKRQARMTDVYPKTFLYVGRYAAFKGIEDLWAVWRDIPDHRGWTLRCIGSGDLYDQRPELPDLEHIGFVQPGDMEPYLTEAGVFVLPSHREPWGVVVHEMAAVGMPMICSDKVMAAEAFVRPGSNGLIFAAINKGALRQAMETMMALSDKELRTMALKSKELSGNISIESWVESLKIIAG
jgi:glycosyltransferase involved in cell wall biosynthesis